MISFGLQRRIGILHELNEMDLEPATGDWRFRHRSGGVVSVQPIAVVRGVAHPVEPLATRVVGAFGDQLA